MPSLRSLLLLLGLAPVALAGQERIELPRARFATGDDSARSRVDFDDAGWAEISTTANYESQGFEGHDGYSWYRFHVTIPSHLRETVRWRERLLVHLSSIDDVDETWFNGVRIGQTGRFPEVPPGYDSRWSAVREYYVELAAGLVRWDRDNVIAVRVYDGGGPGGFFREPPYLRMAEIVDGLTLALDGAGFRYLPGEVAGTVHLGNSFPVRLDGTFSYEIVDAARDRVLKQKASRLEVPAGGTREVRVTTPQRAGILLRYRYTESSSGRSVAGEQPMPYLLTPAEGARPRINGARVVGVRPGSPFLFLVPATGQPPLVYGASGLPPGLALDARTGIIRGRVTERGTHTVHLRVSNGRGADEASLEIRVGDELALTPPMGWNSWNAFGLAVNEARVRATADLLVSSGLAAHGWSYVNIDDGWEAAERAPDGEIVANAKFPDMEALGSYLHARGLRFGIYSSPGPLTCGQFLGSWQHERQDAETYARWGIDYLKYDLCSYLDRMPRQPSVEDHQAPYRLMAGALRAQPRDIVLSLCQYGLADVWTWGAEVGGNSWRTTGDIEDTWESMMGIGRRQDLPAPWARPGHWNDPDMLVVGVVGWGGTPHPSRLTPDEQYAHISLWSLLAAPLLLGNDLTQLDPFTRNLLTNDEVIAVDQDPLGRAARRVLDRDDWQVWVRPLADGRQAVGIFNLGAGYRTLAVDAAGLRLPPRAPVRDLWRQQQVGHLVLGFQAGVPGHGVLLLAVGEANGEGR